SRTSPSSRPPASPGPGPAASLPRWWRGGHSTPARASPGSTCPGSAGRGFEMTISRAGYSSRTACGGTRSARSSRRRCTPPALQSPGYYDALTPLWGCDLRHRLEEISVPALIVWGRNDRVVPVPAALSYKKRIGNNAELVIFGHCGHVPQIERPLRFNRLLD